MKLTLLIPVIVLSILTACSEPSNQESEKLSPVDSLRTVVMDLHNVEMDKMGAMKMMKRSLRDSLDAVDSASHSARFAQIQEAIAALDAGTLAMNSWMRNWSEPDSSQTVDQQMELLLQQQVAMERTSETMRSAISLAENIIKE